MAEIRLEAAPRAVLGKQVRALRRQGFTPANVYGRGLNSLALQAPTPALTRLLREAGRSNIVTLAVEGEKKSRPVLIRVVQRSAITDALLHVDFYQVSLTEKMILDVPVALSGQAPAVRDHGGIMLHMLDRVSVRCLPTAIPAHLEASLSALTAIDSTLHVGDLQPPPDVEILTDPEVVIARVAAPAVLEEVAERAAEAVEAGGAPVEEAAPPSETEA